jgi:hypothetical protein
MPFQSQGLGAGLIGQLQAFMANNDFLQLYQAYDWGNDSYANGFQDIFDLELRLSGNDRAGGISLDDVRAVADWGRLRNPGRVQGPDIALPPNTLNAMVGGPQVNLQNNPEEPTNALANVSGIGPTYQSKVLRFGQAQEYGAIDTRCVRVFGLGDPGAQQQEWLQLYARQSTHRGRPAGWYIPANQSGWPNQYATWINILRYFANQLPNNCPHPENFVDRNLRVGGAWACADVEMALFTYASMYV